MCLQWGSEIGPFKIRKHLKSGLFEDQISNGPFYKCHSFSHSHGPSHSKPNHSKFGHFCLDFKSFFDKTVFFVQISNS